MHQLTIENLGPIRRADVTFGDLTVFVGPQATGKSIALPVLRLLVDKQYVVGELKRHGLDWSNEAGDFLDIYFGEGMRDLWKTGESQLKKEGDHAGVFERIVTTKVKKNTLFQPRLFYIPAQRVLTLRNGWPRPFSDYSPGDPFAVREFSERLRLLMELEFSGMGELFPRKQRLEKPIRDLVGTAIFHDYKLVVEKHHSQKRLVLVGRQPEHPLPFMVWSAGQREFVPLLLGLYWLMPAGSTSRREDVEWVIIEEPEMGLHPRAISVLLLIVVELLRRGYRVCLSTHSQHVLDLVWALRLLREHNAHSDHVLALFGAPLDAQLRKAAESALEKDARVYYFAPDGNTQDITNLDPGSDNASEASWGGLGEFSGRVADVVAEVVAASERRASE